MKTHLANNSMTTVCGSFSKGDDRNGKITCKDCLQVKLAEALGQAAMWQNLIDKVSGTTTTREVLETTVGRFWDIEESGPAFQPHYKYFIQMPTGYNYGDKVRVTLERKHESTQGNT